LAEVSGSVDEEDGTGGAGRDFGSDFGVAHVFPGSAIVDLHLGDGGVEQSHTGLGGDGVSLGSSEIVELEAGVVGAGEIN